MSLKLEAKNRLLRNRKKGRRAILAFCICLLLGVGFEELSEGHGLWVHFEDTSLE